MQGVRLPRTRPSLPWQAGYAGFRVSGFEADLDTLAEGLYCLGVAVLGLRLSSKLVVVHGCDVILQELLLL